MADVRPLAALRFAPSIDPAQAICPPYDVISPDQQHGLHERSPYNAVHLELPPDGDDRYEGAASTLRRWIEEGVLRREEPAFYLYEQQFRHGEQLYRRRSLFARMRLEPWESGSVRPHERTMAPPKEGRLRLLRAVRASTSPVFALYRDEAGAIASLLGKAALPSPIRFEDREGQAHALSRLDDAAALNALAEAFAGETLYVADGHHRYETALAYRDERRACTEGWTREEGENFVLVALTTASDPGLLVLPIHRLVRSDAPLEEALRRLMPPFDLDVAPSLPALLATMERRGKVYTAIGMAAAESPDLYLLSLIDPNDIVERLPSEATREWRTIDTAVLQYAVLTHALGIDEAAIAGGEAVQYTEDAAEALAAVREGRFQYAFFLNPVAPHQIIHLADAGHRLPHKSTFFYPKVPTGLLFNPLDT
ncbi:MAG: DUF1015 domain-containing protein [Chloroflexi bacterium]|nr:DUF1015 domain-containing protein [Chloroflexota bacterium]